MRYILFHPTRNNKIGGAQSLTLNMANELYNQGFNVAVIDHKNGFVASNINQSTIKTLIFDKSINELSNSINKSDILICFNGYIKTLVIEECKIECKVIFWDVYYPFWDSLFGYKKLSIAHFKKVYNKRLFDYLILNNALLSMDSKGVDYYLKYSGLIAPILPVPCKKVSSNLNSKYSEFNRNTYAYIGRFEAWKANPALRILEDLSKLKEDISFDIYTDCASEFDKFIKKHADIPENISINYHVNFYADQLYKSLKNYQIVFAMGTACLEAAQCGIPVILMDFSDVKIEHYNYRFLYENKELGVLGRCVSEVKYNSQNNFPEINKNSIFLREEIISNNLIYIDKYHDLSNLSKRLAELSSKTNLTIPEYVSFMKKIPFYRFGLLSFFKIRKVKILLQKTIFLK